MNLQELFAKFTLLAWFGCAAAGGIPEGVLAAAEWNLFVFNGPRSAETPDSASLLLDMGSMELYAPSATKADTRLPAPWSKSTLEARMSIEYSEPRTGCPAVTEDSFDRARDFHYVDPASRYAVDAYMDEGRPGSSAEWDDEEETDILEADAYEEEEASLEEGGIIGMLVLEDESCLEAALSAMDATEEDYPSSPFILEDEESLEEALRLLDAAEPEDDFEGTAWVIVEEDMEETDPIEVDEIDDGEVDPPREEQEDSYEVSEELTHDWLHYDYQYESDYYERADADRYDELYPDAYAVAIKPDSSEETGSEDDAAERTEHDEDASNEPANPPDENDAETTEAPRETDACYYYPEYYGYDRGMFEYIGGTRVVIDEDAERSAGGDGEDFPEEADGDTKDSTADARIARLWAAYAESHQTADHAAAAATKDTPTVDGGTIREDDASADESDSDEWPEDRGPNPDQTPADFRRMDEDVDEK